MIRHEAGSLRSQAISLEKEKDSGFDDLIPAWKKDATDLEEIADLIQAQSFRAAEVSIRCLDTAVRESIPSAAFKLPVLRDHWETR